MMSTGVKSWCVRYYHRDRHRGLTLGSVTALTLAQEPGRVRDELHAVIHGSDPATLKQAGPKTETIADLAALYIEEWARFESRDAGVRRPQSRYVGRAFQARQAHRAHPFRNEDSARDAAVALCRNSDVGRRRSAISSVLLGILLARCWLVCLPSWSMVPGH